MKAYELLVGEEHGDSVEYFPSKAKAMKAYTEIKNRSKWLDLVEIKTPTATLVIDILNRRGGYILNNTPIAAWTKASGEGYKRDTD